MTTSPRLLASAILAVLLLAVGALVFRGTNDGSAGTSSPGAVQGETTDPALGSTITSAAAAEAAAGMAPAGTYRYRVERRQSGAQPQVYESTLVVTGTGGTRTEERDHLGTRVRRDFALHGNERTELAMVLLNGSYEGRCDWAPDLQSLRTPLEAGRTWKADASCRLPVVNGTVDVRMHEDARVVAVSPEAVQIERSTRLTSAVDGKRTSRTTQRMEWFSPARGLVVRAVERVTETGDGPDRAYETSEELLA